MHINQDVIIYWATLAFSNFALTMFVVALIFIAMHLLVNRRRLSAYEIFYRWIAFFALGLTGFFTFVMHAVYPDMAAANIGWQTSPFQFEVAIADLAFGLLAFLSFKASYGFRLATVIGVTCWLWGDASGHIYQMIQTHNFAPGNAGSWLLMDILLPLVVIICIMKLKPTSSYMTI